MGSSSSRSMRPPPPRLPQPVSQPRRESSDPANNQQETGGDVEKSAEIAACLSRPLRNTDHNTEHKLQPLTIKTTTTTTVTTTTAATTAAKRPFANAPTETRTFSTTGPPAGDQETEDLPRQLQQLEDTLTALGIGGIGARAADSLYSRRTGAAHESHQLNGQNRSTNAAGEANSRVRRRSQMFSWQLKTAQQAQKADSDDHWSYKVEQIEGFDVAKFRAANQFVSADDVYYSPLKRPVTEDTASLDSSIHYDLEDQYILSTIETEYGHQINH